MKEFNTDDYQGKTKKQLEDSYKGAFYAIIGMVLIILLMVIKKEI